MKALKIIGIILIVLGLLTAIGGITIRVVAESNSDFAELSEMVYYFTGEKVNPGFVSKLFSGSLRIMGERVSINDIIDMDDMTASDMQMITMLKLYANSTLILIGGIVLLAAGAVMLVIGIVKGGKKKAKAPAYAPAATTSYTNDFSSNNYDKF